MQKLSLFVKIIHRILLLFGHVRSPSPLLGRSWNFQPAQVGKPSSSVIGITLVWWNLQNVTAGSFFQPYFTKAEKNKPTPTFWGVLHTRTTCSSQSDARWVSLYGLEIPAFSSWTLYKKERHLGTTTLTEPRWPCLGMAG